MTEGCVNIRCGGEVVCVGVVRLIRGVTFGCCEQDWVVIAQASARPADLLGTLGTWCPAPPGRIWVLDADRVLPRAMVSETTSRRMSPRGRCQVLTLEKPMARTDRRSARIVLSAVVDLVADGAAVVIAGQQQWTGDSTKPSAIVVERRRVVGICP